MGWSYNFNFITDVSKEKMRKKKSEDELEKEFERELVGEEGKFSFEPLRNAGIIVGVIALCGGALKK